MNLISIITPSYNQAAFLEDTLRSVELQTGVEIEHIVVDGGSSDGSVEIIRRRADRLAWWISEPDGGQAEALNKGFRRARGELVAWLNSDDVYLPGAVARMAAALERNPQAGMVFGDALTVDATGRPLNRLQFGPWKLDEFLRFRIICQPAVMMRRQVLEQAGWEPGVFIDPGYHFMLDHHLWLRMARLAEVRYIGGEPFAPLAAARHHVGAKNLRMTGPAAEEILRLLAWIETQPDLKARVALQRRQVRGGAHRLAARYLLDGGQAGPALKLYLRALGEWPSYTLRHAHRMLYALLSVVALQRPLDTRRAAAAAAQGRRLADALKRMPGGEKLMEWPGLCLE